MKLEVMCNPRAKGWKYGIGTIKITENQGHKTEDVNGVLGAPHIHIKCVFPIP